MAAEVPQTLEYKGGQLNPAHVLEVENFTNWKKRFLCHIIGIEPQFENIIKNGPYIPMTTDHEKPESQWTSDERKADNLDQNTNHVKDSRRILKGSTGPRQLTKLNVTSVAGWMRPSKDFEAKYNKVKAKLALLSSSVSPLKSTMIKNKGLIAEAYEWDEEEVSLDDNEMVKVKHINTEILKENQNLRNELKELTKITKTWLNGSNKVNQCISEQIPTQKKRILGADQLTEDPSSSGQKDLGFVRSSAKDTKVSIPSVERPWLSEAKGFILSNHDTTNESLVNCTPLPPLEKLSGVEPVFGPKTIKPILKPKSKFKAEALKGIILNDPSSALAKNNKKTSASITNSAPAGKLKRVKTKDDLPLSVSSDILQNKYKTQFKKGCELCGLNNHLSENYYKVLFCKKYERTDHKSCDHAEYMSRMNMSQHLKGQGSSSSIQINSKPLKHSFAPFISQRRGIISRIPQHVPKRCETCGSNAHTTSDHNDIEWFRNGDVSQSRSVMSLNSKWTISNATKSRTPTKSGCSRHMTGVKSYLHKYVEQPRPKVVFGDDSTCITEGYGSVTCNGIVLTKVAFVNGLKYNLVSISQLCDAKYIVQFNEKRRTILNSNKEIVIIDPRVRDVYVLDMTSAEQESCFFARASKNLN
ncbi:hypothetical protein Tco_1392896 [Tanacetum coccineum]